MKTMLITGGTEFVSRYAAEYFRENWKVYVLNRGSRPQPEGVIWLKGDRHDLGDLLKGRHFDVVLDVTAYDREDVEDLLNGLDSFGDYVFISSSAVYPETGTQPFGEEDMVGENRYWGLYGANKIAAEKTLLNRVPHAFLIRPPYLYGSGNNVYREAFLFDCARQDRPFYLPGNGEMKLQFCHIRDLCRFVQILLERRPEQKIFNVGNPDPVSIRDWVTACYGCLGKQPQFVSVPEEIPQRAYFPFYAYEYRLDVTLQQKLLPELTPLEAGLAQAWQWYQTHEERVPKKPLLQYIDDHLLDRIP